MTADEIADQIVEVFNALTDQECRFAAEKPAVLATVEAERKDLGVFVVPKDEQEEEVGDRGFTCKRTRVVSVAVNGPLNDNFTLARYLKQVEALRQSLEGTEFDGYLWSGNETISLWDNEALRIRNRFLALFEATYYTFS